jgi:sec-independent protein translocase protein TatB
MFDIGFSELMVIGLVALIVIGPQRLPRVARTVGHLAGRLQRYVADVKADINREMELEELRKMRDSMQSAASAFESSVSSELYQTESELNKSVEAAASDHASPGQEGVPSSERPAGATESVSPAQETAPAIERKAG